MILRKSVPFWAEQSGNLIIHRQEPQRFSWRLEPAHDFLSSSRMSVCSLSEIVQTFVLTICDPERQVGERGTI